jgi:hypothetical protein
LIKRYGDKAQAKATARAETLADAGDPEGAAVLRRITQAVLLLVPPRCPA